MHLAVPTWLYPLGRAHLIMPSWTGSWGRWELRKLPGALAWGGGGSAVSLHRLPPSPGSTENKMQLKQLSGESPELPTWPRQTRSCSPGPLRLLCRRHGWGEGHPAGSRLCKCFLSGDKSSQPVSSRLPGSRHQESGRLCRCAGTWSGASSSPGPLEVPPEAPPEAAPATPPATPTSKPRSPLHGLQPRAPGS